MDHGIFILQKGEVMSINALGDQSEFSSYHPLVIACYYVLVTGCTMFSMSPFFLLMSLCVAGVYAFLLKGWKGMKGNLILILLILLSMTFINTMFTHNGATVLFYFHHNRITLEALAYGCCMALMLASVVLWFECFQIQMCSEKLIYLFGRLLPVIGLLVSMVFRFVPLLKSRYQEISMGQKCLGAGSCKDLFSQTRQVGKKLSILTAWSLEASLENADSMTARGYGLKGRTSFHLFHFTKRDAGMLVYLAVVGAWVIKGCIAGTTTMIFYPKMLWQMPDGMTWFAFLLLLAAPIVIDIIGEVRWKKSISNM